MVDVSVTFGEQAMSTVLKGYPNSVFSFPLVFSLSGGCDRAVVSGANSCEKSGLVEACVMYFIICV